ncbi:hypothetical protein C1H76_7450 [Elsinoe australis]|uniref:Uncharacterized protein n=1 Tax=Elsinoe australis TaxID=40998 RepID=A0A4U7AXD5_9PEZI|nr:hypothetical protein C1H76_7450 [Elsinoe australis]
MSEVPLCSARSTTSIKRFGSVSLLSLHQESQPKRKIKPAHPQKPLISPSYPPFPYVIRTLHLKTDPETKTPARTTPRQEPLLARDSASQADIIEVKVNLVMAHLAHLCGSRPLVDVLVAHRSSRLLLLLLLTGISLSAI